MHIEKQTTANRFSVLQNHTSPHTQMSHFTEIWLLFLIHQTSNYGYALLRLLKEHGVVQNSFSYGSLYRLLRNLEKAGCIHSKWEESPNGPKRRYYSTSLKGKKELDKWINLFQIRYVLIQKLLSLYDRLLAYEHRES